MGWYYYLQGKIAFPFQTRCVAEKRSSPLQQGEVAEVTDMAPEEDSEHDMLTEFEKS
jgi:Calcium binding